MTKAEASLLMMLECAAVDYGGAFRGGSLNEEDRKIMYRWKEAGLIDYGRIVRQDVAAGRSLWVHLSEEAMETAHALRCMRAVRMWANRKWITTEEKRASEDG